MIFSVNIYFATSTVFDPTPNSLFHSSSQIYPLAIYGFSQQQQPFEQDRERDNDHGEILLALGNRRASPCGIRTGNSGIDYGVVRRTEEIGKEWNCQIFPDLVWTVSSTVFSFKLCA
jgi:hypothetical protein